MPLNEINAPTVSVIMQVNKKTDLLNSAVESLLSQTFRDFELVVVDNTTNEKAQNIVQNYNQDLMIQYCRLNEPLSVGADWNKGLALANGKYIKLLNSNDILAPNCLSTFVEVLEKHESVSIATAFEHFIGGDFFDKMQGFIPAIGEIERKIARVIILNDDNLIGPPSAVMLRRTSLGSGLFDVSLKHNLYWDMWMRLLSVGDLYVIPNILFYRQQQDKTKQQLCSNQSNIECFKERVGLVEASLSSKDNYGGFTEREKATVKKKITKLMINKCFQANNRKLYTEIVLMGLRYNCLEFAMLFLKGVTIKLIKSLLKLILFLVRKILKPLFIIFPTSQKHLFESKYRWLQFKWSDMVNDKTSNNSVEISLDDLRARIITPSGIKLKPITETPHFGWLKSLIDGKEDYSLRNEYRNYIEAYHNNLNPNFNLRKAVDVVKSFQSGTIGKNTVKIMVYPGFYNDDLKSSSFVIYDGIHRAVILKVMGEDKIQCKLVHFREVLL